MTVQYNAESEDKNPTAISFYLGVNILESLDTHTVTAKDDLNGFEIAKHFFGEEKLRTYSVTLSKAIDDKGDQITLRRGGTQWPEPYKEYIQTVLEHALKLENYKLADEKELLKQDQYQNRFIPQTFLEQVVSAAFNSVSRMTAGHGGRMEVLKVDDHNGEVDVHISVTGACSGCPSSSGITAKFARKNLSDAFEKAAKLYPDQPKYTLGNLLMYDPAQNSGKPTIA